MAWFDYLQALGQGTQQGLQTLQSMRTQQQERERLLRQESRLAVQEKERQQDRERALFQERLAQEDPENIDEALVASSRFSKEFVRRDPGTGRLVLRESPTATAERALAAKERGLREKGLPLQEQELAVRGEKLTAEQAARAAVQAENFKTLPYEKRVELMMQAGLPPQTIFARLNPNERKRFALETPEGYLKGRELEAETNIAAMNRAAQTAVAERRIQADVAAAALKFAQDLQLQSGRSDAELQRALMSAAANIARGRGQAGTPANVRDIVTQELLPALQAVNERGRLGSAAAAGSASTAGEGVIRQGPYTLQRQD